MNAVANAAPEIVRAVAAPLSAEELHAVLKKAFVVGNRVRRKFITALLAMEEVSTFESSASRVLRSTPSATSVARRAPPTVILTSRGACPTCHFAKRPSATARSPGPRSARSQAWRRRRPIASGSSLRASIRSASSVPKSPTRASLRRPRRRSRRVNPKSPPRWTFARTPARRRTSRSHACSWSSAARRPMRRGASKLRGSTSRAGRRSRRKGELLYQAFRA